MTDEHDWLSDAPSELRSVGQIGEALQDLFHLQELRFSLDSQKEFLSVDPQLLNILRFDRASKNDKGRRVLMIPPPEK